MAIKFVKVNVAFVNISILMWVLVRSELIIFHEPADFIGKKGLQKNNCFHVSVCLNM